MTLLVFFSLLLILILTAVFFSRNQLTNLPQIEKALGDKLEKYFNKFKYQIYVIILFFSSIIYFNQTRMIWYQFIDIPAFISDEAILAQEASKYPQELVIDGEFIPASLFYSGKGSVRKAPRDNLGSFLASENNILMITHKWRLDQANVSSKDYQIIKEDRDKILVLYKKSN